MVSVINDFSSVIQQKNKVFITSNKHVIDNWNSHLNASNSTFIDALDILISKYVYLIQKRKNFFEFLTFEDINLWYRAVLKDNEEHFKTGHNFNIFSLLKENFGFNIQETMHSRLIKFLFDSTETHGQTNLFLIQFLNMLNIESPEKGVWHVTAEICRIDILIERKYPPSIIVIENKSNWAIDQPNQLYRYWFQAIYQKTKQHSEEFYNNNTHKYQILYLVPNTNKEIEQHSMCKPSEYSASVYHELPDKVPMQITTITFDDLIQKWLNNCLIALPENNHRIREYIKQYQSLCNNL